MPTGALTEDQKVQIIATSQQAQNFLASDLFKRIEEWIKQEKEALTKDILYNNRGKLEQNLTLEQFVMKRSGYYLSLDTIPALLKQWASQEAELKKMEEKKNGPVGSTSKE